jgi:hypothetical protein
VTERPELKPKEKLSANISASLDAAITQSFKWPWTPDVQKLYARLIGIVEDLTEELADKLFAAELLLKSAAVKSALEQQAEIDRLREQLAASQAQLKNAEEQFAAYCNKLKAEKRNTNE